MPIWALGPDWLTRGHLTVMGTKSTFIHGLHFDIVLDGIVTLSREYGRSMLYLIFLWRWLFYNLLSFHFTVFKTIISKWDCMPCISDQNLHRFYIIRMCTCSTYHLYSFDWLFLSFVCLFFVWFVWGSGFSFVIVMILLQCLMICNDLFCDC